MLAVNHQSPICRLDQQGPQQLLPLLHGPSTAHLARLDVVQEASWSHVNPTGAVIFNQPFELLGRFVARVSRTFHDLIRQLLEEFCSRNKVFGKRREFCMKLSTRLIVCRVIIKRFRIFKQSAAQWFMSTYTEQI